MLLQLFILSIGLNEFVWVQGALFSCVKEVRLTGQFCVASVSEEAKHVWECNNCEPVCNEIVVCAREADLHTWLLRSPLHP